MKAGPSAAAQLLVPNGPLQLRAGKPAMMYFLLKVDASMLQMPDAQQTLINHHDVDVFPSGGLGPELQSLGNRKDH